ncbi:MAG: metal-sensitive transcriptional regulator [Defluviitaleaceae bacterium]|nr:metal-sensitive transcriptional regulator [Defluviitaleaceae bacterium]
MSERPDGINKSLVSRLNRIEGQVRGIKGMIERGEYCDDVLTQIASVQSALSGVGKVLLESHVKTCIGPKLARGDDGVVDELIKSVGRLVK